MTYRENAKPDEEPTLCTQCMYGLNHEGDPLHASDEPDYAECCSPTNGTNPVTGNTRLEYCRKKNDGACPDFSPRQIRKKSKKSAVAARPSQANPFLEMYVGALIGCVMQGVAATFFPFWVVGLVAIVGTALVIAWGAWRSR